MPPRVPRPPRSAGCAARRAARGADDDAGAVTVEAAIALGALVLVAALAVAAVAAVVASMRCADAAREAVRLAARGEPDRGREVAARLAPTGAEVELRISGDEALAHVTAVPFTLLPVRIGASAVGVLEPGAPPGSGTAAPAGGEPPHEAAGTTATSTHRTDSRPPPDAAGTTAASTHRTDGGPARAPAPPAGAR